MKPFAIRFLLFFLVACSAVAERANAGCCALCGTTAGCQPRCRLVYEEQKIETVCWGCKREDFCVPGPSKKQCEYCEDVCETCDPKPGSTHAEPKKFVWSHWCPGSAKLYTKTKLMKKVVTKKVPGYKWVVEEMCPHCHAQCQPPEILPGVAVPPPPSAQPAVARETETPTNR